MPHSARLSLLCLALLACGTDAEDDPAPDAAESSADVLAEDVLPEDAPPARPPTLRVMTFNTGTTEGLPHDTGPDDGYTSAHATLSDTYYGDGLAWLPAVEAVTHYLSTHQPDIVVFQEIFHSPECAEIPPEAHADFVCESWTPTTPTVAETVTGAGYGVRCHPNKPDKCIAIRLEAATWADCPEATEPCPPLDGAPVPDCGKGARVAATTLNLATGGQLRVVSVHGSSGFAESDMDCRASQFRQIFEATDPTLPPSPTNPPLAPAGADAALPTVILGDFNTDPARAAEADPSAAYLLTWTKPPSQYRFLTSVSADAPPTYANLFNIDHVLSNHHTATCTFPPPTPTGHPLLEATYFDHLPITCDLTPKK